MRVLKKVTNMAEVKSVVNVEIKKNVKHTQICNKARLADKHKNN